MAQQTKDQRIRREKRRLVKLLADMGDDRMQAASKLIDRAAFLAATLEDLEATINANGPTSRYQNGEHQFGDKRSAEADLHVAMSKTYLAVVGKLVDLLPAPTPPEREGTGLPPWVTENDPLLDYVSR